MGTLRDEVDAATQPRLNPRLEDKRIRFYRRHLPGGHRKLSEGEAMLSGWAQLLDFAGALRGPEVEHSFLGPDDDLGALAEDWNLVGDDAWRGVSAVLNSLPPEKIHHLRSEVVEIFADVMMRFAPSDREQLRLDLGSGNDQPDN
jgi:hypothetical protein